MTGCKRIIVATIAAVCIAVTGCGGGDGDASGSSSSSVSGSVTGSWQGTVTYVTGTVVPLYMELVQTGSTITSPSSFNTTSGGVSVSITVSGTIAGSDVEIDYVQRLDGMTILLFEMDGTLSGSTMSGTVDIIVPGGGSTTGTWTATKV